MGHAHHPPFEQLQASRPDFDGSKEYEVTKVPAPDFKAGQGLNNLPASKDFQASTPFKEVDPDAVISEGNAGVLYKMMIGGITPRPIAFISTIDENGVSNLAPMSYFAMVNHNPPMICVTPAAGGETLKDTALNIKATKEFAVSIISEPFLEASNFTSVDSPPEVDEFKLAGLTKRASTTIKSPHVAESAFSMECTLEHSYEMKSDEGKVTGVTYFGRIRRFHIKEFVLDPGDPGYLIMPEKFKAISRLGGITYARIGDRCEVPRPVWEKIKDTPEVKAALEAPDKTIDARL